MDHVVGRIIQAIKEQQQDIAVGLAIRPKVEVLAYGVEAGKYQGLEAALETISQVLNDLDQKEKHS